MGKINAIQRYLIIIRKIKTKPYISLEDLQQEVTDELLKHGSRKPDISTRTLKRDIQDIRNDLNIPLLYSHLENGYYFSETEVWSPDNIERLLEPFDLLNTLNADTGLNRIVFPEKRIYRGTEYLLPLVKACQACHPVRFRYQKFGDSQYSERKLYPYCAKEFRKRWYLLGTEEEQATSLKTFGLDRLSNLEILSGTFRKNPAIDFKNKFRDLFGILDDPNRSAEEVILSFNSRDGEFLKSLPIHHSQEILEDDPEKDKFVIRLYIKITRDLIMELLSRSWSIKVIQPLYLKQEIYKICMEAVERNNFGQSLDC